MRKIGFITAILVFIAFAVIPMAVQAQGLEDPEGHTFGSLHGKG